MKNKERLDVLLVSKGLVASRERAAGLIMSGIVYINGQKGFKSGEMVDIDADIDVRGSDIPFVSRGGLKLKKGLDEFKISLDSKIAMDIGASTGGFTDCMLQNGAKSVYAVDVGYGQLAWKLRCDSRVINMERTNIRYIEKDSIRPLGFVSIDVSFISLKLVLPVAYELMSDGGEMIALIKPQFEAGRDKVGKKGVVRDKNTHEEVIHNVISYATDCGFIIKGVSYSPIKGPEGNIEYLLYVKKGGNEEQPSFDIKDVVESAHNGL